MVEIALMTPWILFLFIALVDFGFYAHAAISTENAARLAALDTAASQATVGSQPLACSRVLDELRTMPNASSFPVSCDSAPLTVTVASFTDSEGKLASRVQVTYQTIPLFPLPFLMGKLNMSRMAEVRVYGE